MSDRLSELRRQRALLEQHLAWLDREIAAGGQQSPAGLPSPTPQESPPAHTLSSAPAAPSPRVPPFVSGTAPVAGASADHLLDEYRVAPDTLRNDVRKGCLLYFTLAFVLLVAGVAILWLTLRR